MAQAPAKAKKKGYTMTTDTRGWCCTLDTAGKDDWVQLESSTSREEAIADAVVELELNCGDKFRLGRYVEAEMPGMSLMDILDALHLAMDNVGVEDSDWPNATGEQESALVVAVNNAIEEWAIVNKIGLPKWSEVSDDELVVAPGGWLAVSE